ncbi:MAG: alcohol dehydrogenase catalytic domain-containing protein [Abditibacteriota bacterium]|nr:alcohol dehydrogenase catalytic domain-containing protein [Abditibacteriota bacterium]
MNVKSVFVKSPFNYELRNVELPPLKADEALVEVIACGICGYDMEISACLSPNGYTALGHEYVGVVREVGGAVDNVKPGDRVTAESSTFCGVCDDCRNERVDLCRNLKTSSNGYAQGFAEMTVVPAKSLVVCNDIDPLTAVLSEPAGVSFDLVKTAEVQITDDVLIVGMGPIGFMALQIARKITAGRVVVVDRHDNRRQMALDSGADVAYASLDDMPSEETFGKILLTAVPQLLPACILRARYGGYIAFLGSNFKDGNTVPLDTGMIHFNRLQLRSSFASPATFFPYVHKLMRAGIIDGSRIVTGVYTLSHFREAFDKLRNDKDHAMKVVVVNDNSGIKERK